MIGPTLCDPQLATRAKGTAEAGKLGSVHTEPLVRVIFCSSGHGAEFTMGKTAERTDPELWEKIKQEVTSATKGGQSGQWSARKAQLAVQQYKKAGGRYAGRKTADNSLRQWQEEDWGTRSGSKSADTGERYLPRQAREELSDQEHRRTSAKKRADTAKWCIRHVV